MASEGDMASQEDMAAKGKPVRKGSSLRFHLTAVFVILIAAIVGTIAYITYFKNTEAVLDLADRFITRTSTATVQRTKDHLEPLAATMQHLAKLAEGNPAMARSHEIFPTLRTVLDTYPQLQAVYYGFKSDGRFLMAYQIPPNTKVFGRPNYTSLPDGVHYIERTLTWTGDPSDHWEYLSKDGDLLFQEDAFRMSYDVRKRKWFQDALTHPNQRSWTNVVVFTSSQLPGFAPVFPIHDEDGEAIGVAAANITLDTVSRFLSELEVGKNGVAFIMDENRQLIAHPETERSMKRTKEKKLVLVKADELAEPWVSGAVKEYAATNMQKFRIIVDGTEYLASFTPFPDDFGKKWIMAVIVPTSDFVGALKASNRNILFIAILITILGVLMVGAFAGWITTPVRQLVDEIGKIQEFDLTGDVKIRSGMTEIMALSDSIKTMKRALQTFGKFVPKTLVREMVKSGQSVELGGQSRHLTMMFTDIQGFSTIAERSPTRELMLQLSDHFECITEAIRFNNGTIDKFIGDSVMAFWGAPVWDENHVYQGCLSALMAKSHLDLLNEEWAKEGRPQFHVRFGLHTDAVLVGNIGARDRLSYTVLGDGVNVASRLEGVNKVYGTQLITSHSVYQEAGERCLFRPLDMVAVQGRRAGIIIYELLGTINDGHPDFQASDELRLLADKSRQAFYAYVERKWDEAHALYSDILTLAPNDRVASMFLSRCHEYRSSPPPEDWSGIYTLKSK